MDLKSKDPVETYDTIVIGAGISGLCSARKLESFGENVLVVEARDRVGGRTYTIRDDSHSATDVGGAYIGPTQNRAYRLIKELGLIVYNVHDTDSNILDLQDIWSTFFGNIPPFWNPFKLLDVNNIIRSLDSMAKQVPKEAPWKAKKAKEWDSITVSEYLDKVVWTRAAKELVVIFIRAVLCVEPCEVSLLGFLWYIHSGGGVQRMSSITNGAQILPMTTDQSACDPFPSVTIPIYCDNENVEAVQIAFEDSYKRQEKKIDGGSQQISERIAEKLKNGVKLSSPIMHIYQNDDEIIVTDLQGNTYKASHVISSLPVSLLNKITFDPPLSGERIQMIQKLPMGSIIKTIMFYNTPFWREMGLNGSVTSSKGVCNYCIDDTKPDGSHPAIMGFILADRARDMALVTADLRKKSLCEFYSRVFGSDKFMEPSDYIEYNWMEDPYSGGCYTGVMGPKFLTTYGRYLREPFGRLFFAGTQTATVWSGYIDGAIQAGERAACQVLYEDGKIPEHEIWSVEPESIDYPAAPVTDTLLEQYLPSNTTLFRCAVAGSVAFVGYSMYLFFCGWRGALFWRWVAWRYELDEYTYQNLASRIRFPTFWKDNIKS